MKGPATPEYQAMWGHREKRMVVGHPKREDRRNRAAVRQAEEALRPIDDPRRKAVRKGK